MRVFVDTNILIDYVCKRSGFVDDAYDLFTLGHIGKVSLQTSALSFVTAMYVASKYGYQEVKESLKKIVAFVEILDLKSDTVVNMLSSDWKDYEDAVQNQTAIIANCDCIVTRNKKDFRQSSLPVYSVEELFDAL